MQTLNIPISDIEFNEFGFTSNTMSFAELKDIINRALLKQNLQKSIELSKKYNLCQMTMDEISNEIKSVRNAKSNN